MFDDTKKSGTTVFHILTLNENKILKCIYNWQVLLILQSPVL